MAESAIAQIGRRRYMLRDEDRRPIKDVTGEPLWFLRKTDAKSYRDQMAEGCVISCGPDHRKW